MPKYRKKPIVIEAMPWKPSDEQSEQIRKWAGFDNIIDTDSIRDRWDYDVGGYRLPGGKVVFAPAWERCLIVLTLEGEMVAQPGDWIIKGVSGEPYPCKPDIFEATYEPVEVPLTLEERMARSAHAEGRTR